MKRDRTKLDSSFTQKVTLFFSFITREIFIQKNVIFYDNTIDSFVSVDYADQNYSILLFDVPIESIATIIILVFISINNTFNIAYEKYVISTIEAT